MKYLNEDLIWRVFENAASQIAGRLIISVLRFIIIFIIIRESGVAMAGNYGVILGLILLFENTADFGMTNVAVRRLCQNPEQASGLIQNLIKAKSFLTLLSAFGLVATILLLNYPTEMVWAGSIAAIGLFFFGGILVFRSIFRYRLKMGREVMAEILGVLISIPFFLLATSMEAGLTALVGCYVLSRLIYLLLSLLWSRKEIREVLQKSKTVKPQPRGLFAEAWPLGVSEIFVGVYFAIDPLLLSVFHSPTEAGLFFGTMRFITMMGLLAQALADTTYPVLASFWKKSMTKFYFTMNAGFRAVTFIGGGGLTLFYVTAGFLLALMGPEMTQAEDLFRLLSFYAFLRALSAFIGPLVIVSGGIKYAPMLTFYPIGTKVLFLFLLVPEYGAMGAAYSCIISEFVNVLATSITSWILIRKHLDWMAVAKVSMAATIAIVTVIQLNMFDTLLGGIVAVILYILLAFLFEVIPPHHTHKLMTLYKLRFSKPLRSNDQ